MLRGKAVLAFFFNTVGTEAVLAWAKHRRHRSCFGVCETPEAPKLFWGVRGGGWLWIFLKANGLFSRQR